MAKIDAFEIPAAAFAAAQVVSRIASAIAEAIKEQLVGYRLPFSILRFHGPVKRGHRLNFEALPAGADECVILGYTQKSNATIEFVCSGNAPMTYRRVVGVTLEWESRGVRSLHLTTDEVEALKENLRCSLKKGQAEALRKGVLDRLMVELAKDEDIVDPSIRWEEWVEVEENEG